MKPIKAQPLSVNGLLFTQWKPTWCDRLRVLFGHPIRIGVLGPVQPTLSVDTQNLVAK